VSACLRSMILGVLVPWRVGGSMGWACASRLDGATGAQYRPPLIGGWHMAPLPSLAAVGPNRVGLPHRSPAGGHGAPRPRTRLGRLPVHSRKRAAGLLPGSAVGGGHQAQLGGNRWAAHMRRLFASVAFLHVRGSTRPVSLCCTRAGARRLLGPAPCARLRWLACSAQVVLRAGDFDRDGSASSGQICSRRGATGMRKASRRHGHGGLGEARQGHAKPQRLSQMFPCHFLSCWPDCPGKATQKPFRRTRADDERDTSNNSRGTRSSSDNANETGTILKNEEQQQQR
jgi:hypothetical protein